MTKTRRMGYELWEDFFKIPEMTEELRITFLDNTIKELGEKKHKLLQFKKERKNINDKLILRAYKWMALFIAAITLIGWALDRVISPIMYFAIIAAGFFSAYRSYKDADKKMIKKVHKLETEIESLEVKKEVLKDLLG